MIPWKMEENNNAGREFNIAKLDVEGVKKTRGTWLIDFQSTRSPSPMKHKLCRAAALLHPGDLLLSCPFSLVIQFHLLLFQ